jgi:uncharacterized protein (TIGR03435 family)
LELYPRGVTCILSLRDLIREAFEIKTWQISGPDTLDGDYYALEAVMPATTTRSEAHLMLRSLLKARFQLRFHMEQKVLQAYSLTVDKSGLKVKLLEGEPKPVQFGNENGRFYGRSVSASGLAAALTSRSDRPVLDDTGLEGRFDFDCTWTPDPDVHAGGAKMLDPGLIAALRTQAGLRLEPKRLPREIIVVDHVEKTPTRIELSTRQRRPHEVAIHACDHFQLDVLRAHRLAFADVGATAEHLGVRLRDHRLDA